MPPIHTPQGAAHVDPELAGAVQLLAEIGDNLSPTPAGRRDGFTFLGYGALRITTGIAGLEPKVRRSVNTLHLSTSFSRITTGYALNRRSDRRRIDMWSAVPEAYHTASPLLSLQELHYHAGPVPAQMMVLDNACAVIPGATHWSGEPSAWATTDPETVRTARKVVAFTKSVAKRPVSPLADVVTPRQLAVARLLLLGGKNSTTARHLGVSERTLGSDIAGLLRALGLESRGELVSVLGGLLGKEYTAAHLM